MCVKVFREALMNIPCSRAILAMFDVLGRFDAFNGAFRWIVGAGEGL